jgi:acyl-CoA thioester hydrolase
MSEELEKSERPGVVLSLRVRYFETDQMKVVHHAHYFVWFEAARSEFCRKHGIDYSRMEAEGLFLPVVDVRCRYKMPARYDDDITVQAVVVERTRRTLRIVYTVRRSEIVLAEGETLQMLVDAEGRPRSFPEEIATRFDVRYEGPQ